MGRDHTNRTGQGDAGGKSAKRVVGRRAATKSNASAAVAASAYPSGCMRSVFQIFDFQNFQLYYSLNPQHHRAPDTLEPHSAPSPLHDSRLKGQEAPRNSLESEDGLDYTDSALSVSDVPSSEKLNLSIPEMRKIQIKTNRTTSDSNVLSSGGEFSEARSSSPGPKTPSLVARLMGLDLLPESSSPSSTSSFASATKFRKRPDYSGTRSLPDSPRMSLGSRKSDVDLHHRLSLQISKENNGRDCEEDQIAICKRRELIKNLVQNSEAENWSPSHYAKQIVKQIKEGVGRRVGLTEITNTVRNRAGNEHRRDHNLLTTTTAAAATTTTTTTTTVTPPPTFSSKKTVQQAGTSFKSEGDENQAVQGTTAVTGSENSQTLKPTKQQSDFHLTVPSRPEYVKPFAERSNNIEKQNTVQKKCKKADAENFSIINLSPSSSSSSANGKKKKKKNQEETWSTMTLKNHNHKKTPIPMKSKKTSVSTTELLNVIANVTSSSLSAPLKNKVHTAKPTKPHSPKQVPDKKHLPFTTRDLSLNDPRTAGQESGGAKKQTLGGKHEIETQQYMSKILKCIGIGSHTSVNISNQFSSTQQPLNPTIFRLLEPLSTHQSSGQLSLRCNRKLVFELVNELLTVLVKTQSLLSVNGAQLLHLLAEKIASFPSANCQVLQDIDALVGIDHHQQQPEWTPAESVVVMDIEREILDSLMYETVAFL